MITCSDPIGEIPAEPETTTPDGVVIFVLLSDLIVSKLPTGLQ